MDPILLELRGKSCGLNLNGLFLGALSHADLSDCRRQIKAVSSFANSRNLCLSTEKCEVVISPSNPKNLSHIKIDAYGIDIPVSQSARCLGAWWSSSLTPNIKKARRAFFARGSGQFHGTLNPLSSRSIIKCCVFPVLLYGAESWVLNLTLLKKLESFQCKRGKRILRLPMTTANNIVRIHVYPVAQHQSTHPVHQTGIPSEDREG